MFSKGFTIQEKRDINLFRLQGVTLDRKLTSLNKSVLLTIKQYHSQ